MNYYLLPILEIKELLNTGQHGLSTTEAEERLLQYGKNELTEKKKKPVWLLFLNQFKDVMIFILLIAAVISVAIGDIKDAIVILIIVCTSKNLVALLKGRLKKEQLPLIDT